MGHTGYVAAIAVSPDRRFIASGGLEGTVKIWDSRVGRLWRSFDVDSGFFVRLAFAPDNRLVAAGSGNAIRLVDAIGGSQVRTLTPCVELMVTYRSGDTGYSQPSQVTSLAFDPDGAWLASACDGDAGVTLWDVTTGRQIRRIPDSPAPAGLSCWSTGKPPPCGDIFPPSSGSDGLTAIAVSPDGQWLATGARDRKMRVWELATGRLLLERAHADAIGSVTFSADGRFLTSSDGRTAVLWQLPDGTEVRRTPGRAIAISKDQRWLTATSEGTIRVWNIAAARDEVSLPPPDPGSTVPSADGRFLMAVRRGAPMIIDLATRQETVMVEVAPATWRLALSHDGGWAWLQPYGIAGRPPKPATTGAAGDERSTRSMLWRMGSDHPVTLPGRAGGGDAVFSDDGRLLAGFGDDGSGAGPITNSRTIRVWEVSSARMLAELSSPWTTKFAFSPDGRWVAAVGNDTTPSVDGNVLRIWNAATGDLVRSQAGRWSPDVAFSPDSRVLAAATGSKISFQEVESGRQARTLDGRPPFVFSPDGRLLLAAVPVKAELRVWDLATGSVIRTLPHSLYEVPILAISSNGRWLVTGSWPNDSVTLWDVTTGQPVRSYAGYGVGFSADGNRLRVTGLDGVTRFWDMRDGTLVASLVLGEDLSDWVIAAGDGRVDGSESGLRKFVSWRVGDTVYPADRFLKNHRTPGLLDQVLNDR